MIDALSRATDAGDLTITQGSIANGQEMSMRISEGFLQAVGAAARQAQQQNAPPGQF
jgi:hypothetical protein